jgi:hypothetical protein
LRYVCHNVSLSIVIVHCNIHRQYQQKQFSNVCGKKYFEM